MRVPELHGRLIRVSAYWCTTEMLYGLLEPFPLLFGMRLVGPETMEIAIRPDLDIR
jgi:hypothetical protein